MEEKEIIKRNLKFVQNKIDRLNKEIDNHQKNKNWCACMQCRIKRATLKEIDTLKEFMLMDIDELD